MAPSYVNALNQEETPVVQNAAQQSQTQQSTPYTEALTSATNQAAAQSQTAGTTPTVQQTATYIDDSGNKQTGYVSVLANDDDLTYWQRMEKFYNDQYEAAKASNDAAAKAKYAAAMEQINRKIEALNETYAGTNRQLYRDYMNNQRILPQQMAAMGYSGGLTESSNVRLRNSYEEALAENERSKAGQIADLNAQGVQYQYDADAEAAVRNSSAVPIWLLCSSRSGRKGSNRPGRSATPRATIPGCCSTDIPKRRSTPSRRHGSRQIRSLLLHTAMSPRRRPLLPAAATMAVPPRRTPPAAAATAAASRSTTPPSTTWAWAQSARITFRGRWRAVGSMRRSTTEWCPTA